MACDGVDLHRDQLTITCQLQRVKGQLLHRETKTPASAGVLPLPDLCSKALELRRLAQDEARITAGTGWQELGLVFTTRYGTPIEPRNFNRSGSRISCAGVPDITVHDARRTCASLLVDLDVHPRVAMQVLDTPDLGDHGGLRASFF